MLIVGSKGFAKELLEVLHHNQTIDNVAFFDNVNSDVKGKLYDTFPIIKTFEDVAILFKTQGTKFTIGIGNPKLRKSLYNQFIALGGENTTVISKYAKIGFFGNTIGEGTAIMTDAIITSNVTLGKSCLINKQALIGHDVIIGDFSEIAPGAKIGGNVTIGSTTFVGMNATILQKVTIGNNVIIAAGAVVTQNLPDNCMVAGVPAVIKKQINP
ncbi:acetyltransferase [Flavobacterium sp. J27]|uniref:acetyltransferase n=1 Tax=Flavobacterium sp. J27 TaxID=2060419 RepID=UPI0010305EE0|nr:acetyltransferase [Flavobacterium sp. J27]